MLYFVSLTVWAFLAVPLTIRLSHKHRERTYCILMFIALTALQGFRSIDCCGVDTSLVYAASFERIISYDMRQVFLQYGSRDLLFYVLTKLFTFVCTDVQVYLMLISMFAIGSYCMFVYKYSEHHILSFVCYFALNYYAAGFQMLRHVVALSVLLLAYPAMKERRPVRFVLIVLLASMFHSTALVFLMAYPIAHMKIGWRQWGIFAAAFALCFVFKGYLKQILTLVFSGDSRYGMYVSADYSAQLSVVGLLILLCFYVVSFLLMNGSDKEDPRMLELFNMSALSICFMAMVVVIGEFHRISMYFGIYNTLLLPAALQRNRFNRNSKLWLMRFATAVLVLYFLFFGLENCSLLDYHFFWQA